MTRPKVPDDKRQRTAQACDTCKRRKQKCNGLKPCNTCTKRSMTCCYSSSNSAEQTPQASAESPTKRRHIEEGLSTEPLSAAGNDARKPRPPPAAAPQLVKPAGKSKPWEGTSTVHGVNSTSFKTEEHDGSKLALQVETGSRSVTFDNEARSRQSTASGMEEEAEVYTETRMLQDPTGRLLYVGDSATLSYLQLIRMVVENSSGTSPFTLDPSRHKIMENTITLPPNIRPPHILPDPKTARILVESYFTNTCGLIEIFNRATFLRKMDACFNDPLSVDSPYLCLLYLTFAIGLVMATPSPRSPDEETIKRLRTDPFDRAEAFFRSAKCLADPVSGFEDADFWSVQALSLMSVYMLAVSKRNAAYAYYGMAVRSAFALGLHRVLETRIIFSGEEAIVRRNLWRSLFVLDRFLAASLGRPTAISEDDCSPDALDSPIKSGEPLDQHYTPSSAFQNAGLDASVEACKVIGRILKTVYAKRKATTKRAQEFANETQKLEQFIQEDLSWRRAESADIDASQGIAILHVNLLCCHSVILYTRPFFLYLIIKDARSEKSGSRRTSRINSRMEKFASHCVRTSSHTIELVQNALERNYLPRKNPFVLYFLFAASLILLSNEFAGLHKNPTYESSITKAIGIIEYCAVTDPQAERLKYILSTFKDVVTQKRAPATESTRAMAAYAISPVATHNPMAGVLGHDPSTYPNSPRGSFTESVRKDPLGVGTGVGVPSTMAPPTGIPVGGVSGASPASTGGHSGDGFPGRASDLDPNDHLTEEEVNFEALWDWSGAPNSGAVQMPESSPMQNTATTMGQYAPYFVTNSTAVPAGSMASSVPLYATSQYQRTV